MKSSLFLITVILMSVLPACAQTSTTRTYTVGDDVSGLPLNKIIRYPAKINTVSDLKGKLVILDFWATWCSPCVAAFTKMEEIKKRWPEAVLVLPVTSESEAVVTNFFKRKNTYTLPSVIEDSTLMHQFPHTTIPHEVIINAEGKVVAITGAEDITEASIEKLLTNQSPELFFKKDVLNFRLDMPLLVDSNSGIDHTIAFRSMILPCIQGIPSAIAPETKVKGESVGFFFVNNVIPHLYLYALSRPPEWFWSRLVMENVKDTLAYRSDNLVNYTSSSNAWARKNLFCYDLIAPGLNDAERKAMMLQTLNAYFGQSRHLHGSLATRNMDCFVLKRIPGKNIPKSTSDLTVNTADEDGNESLNQESMSDLATYIENNIHIPVLDRTKSTTRIDLVIKKTILKQIKHADPSALKEVLASIGLYVEKSKQPVEVLLFEEK